MAFSYTLCLFLVYKSQIPELFYTYKSKTTVSQDVQIRFSVQLTTPKFLSKIEETFNTVTVSWILSLY